MTYEVRVHKGAEKDLLSFPAKHQQQILRRIKALAGEPRPPGCTLFEREGNYEIYRIKSGTYRILYGVDDAGLVVLAIHIGNRKDVYRNLPAIYKRVGATPKTTQSAPKKFPKKKKPPK